MARHFSFQMSDLNVLPSLAIDFNTLLSEVAAIGERALAHRIESARAALTAHADALQVANETYRRRMLSLRARVARMRRDRAEAIAAIMAADEQRRTALAFADLAYQEACANALHATQLHTQSAEEAVAGVEHKRIEFAGKWDAAWAAAHDLDEERDRLEILKDGAARAFDETELQARLDLERAKAEADELMAQAEIDARATLDGAIAAAMNNDYGAVAAQRRLALVERRNRRAAAIPRQAITRLVGEREAALAAADAALAEAQLWDSEGFDALQAEERLRAQEAEAKAKAEAEAQIAREAAIEAEAAESIQKWTLIAIKVCGNPHALRAQRAKALQELGGSPARNRAGRAIRKVFAGLNEANQYFAGFDLTDHPLPTRGWRIITESAVNIYTHEKKFFAGWLWREQRQSDALPFAHAAKEAVVKYTFGAEPKRTIGVTIRDAIRAKQSEVS